MAYHEQGVVGTSANHADLDAVFGIPLFMSLEPGGMILGQHATHPCIAVENVDIIASVQVVNGSFAVDFESI